MDPKATLELVARAIRDADFDLASELLRAYREWRLHEGFEPVMFFGMKGDNYASELERRAAENPQQRPKTMNIFRNARDLIRGRATLIIVNDGAFRWVGDKADIKRWLAAQGLTSRTASEMTADQYQQLCDSTACWSDRIAIVGSGDLVRFVNLLAREGCEELIVG